MTLQRKTRRLTSRSPWTCSTRVSISPKSSTWCSSRSSALRRSSGKWSDEARACARISSVPESTNSSSISSTTARTWSSSTSKVETTEGAIGASLAKRLFTARLELLSELDRLLIVGAGSGTASQEEHSTMRGTVANLLNNLVAAMNLNNFIVRRKRRLVEKYTKDEAWVTLTPEEIAELSHEVAGLPSEVEPEGEEAKRFDFLMLNLQLALLRSEPAFERLRDQLKGIAGLLEEKSAIPMVHAQMALIQDVQTDEWWLNVTTPMLESVRRRLRDLVRSEEHTSELQSLAYLVCRLLLEKKKTIAQT